jgi:hypothetical protein
MPGTPQHVKDLIQKAYEEKATFLDLGNCGLKEIPKEIEMLSGFLEELNLGRLYWLNDKGMLCENTGQETIFLCY